LECALARWSTAPILLKKRFNKNQKGESVQNLDKKTEWRSFVLLVVFLAPILSIAIVGGYGFIVWISQIILGPPGI
jgi:periplasmic nitrate reductase NapE